jgi:ABC-type branched-subunit amino acid transport system substrate-binding protein
MTARSSAILLLTAFVLAGCQRSGRGLRIAILTDLTGPQAEFGQGIRAAADLALADYRDILGRTGWRVDLAAFDAHNSAHDQPDAVSRIALDPDVFCVVVHSGTEENLTAAQILHTAGIPTIMPLETAPLSSGVGLADAVWLSADDRMHGAAVAEWAADGGRTRVFLLTDQDARALAVGEGFALRADELGLQTTGFPVSPNRHASDWIHSFPAAEPHLVFFSGSSRQAVTILRDLETLSFHGSFLFAESEGEDRLPEDFASETVALFFSPAVEHSEAFARNGEFAERYRSAYHTSAPDLSVMGYDAAAICLQSLLALDAADPGPYSPREQIGSHWRSGVTFPGLAGDYSTAGVRPCRVRIFARPADSDGAWSAADTEPTGEDADSACARSFQGTADPSPTGFRFLL